MSGMNSDNAIVIDVRNVVKHYGSLVALKKISLSINDNEFFTLLGPSGCGKTTLLRMIAGFEDTTEGEILLFGQQIGNLPPHQRPINTVFQNYALFPHISVLDNVSFGLQMQGRPKQEVRRRAGEMLELVKLSQFANRRPSQLSGGQQQRVALARALAPQPKVLLLDEPLSALDLKLRKAMQRELKQLQRETGITFIFVTHDQEEALTMSDRIAVMSEGALQQFGNSRDIYERPRNRFVADFIGATNLFDVTVEKIEGKIAFCNIGASHVLPCDAIEGVKKGDKVHASARPERLVIADKATNEHSLTGTVIDNIFIGTDISTIVELENGLKVTIRTSNSDRGNKRLFEKTVKVFVTIEEGALRLLVD